MSVVFEYKLEFNILRFYWILKNWWLMLSILCI